MKDGDGDGCHFIGKEKRCGRKSAQDTLKMTREATVIGWLRDVGKAPQPCELRWMEGLID